MNRIALALPLLLGLAACVDADEPLLEESHQAVLGCPSWGCSTNSPLMGPYGMDELNELGVPNEAGVSILSLRKNGVDYRPDVVGDRLVGRNPDGTVGLSGQGLVQSYFRLQAPDGIYKMYIMAVDEVVKFWIGPQDIIETYELQFLYPINFGGYYPVCLNAPGRLDPEGNYWLARFDAILFTGDRYNSQYKTVTATTPREAGSWFNIACAGSAKAKLHLNRHTWAGSTTGFTTTQPQRQTLLKTYVGDMCGSGTAFTKQGTPLHWINSTGWKTFTGTESYNEAFWNMDGAMCMYYHRLHFTPDNMDADIQAECGALPDCTTLPGYPSMSAMGAYVRTRF